MRLSSLLLLLLAACTNSADGTAGGGTASDGHTENDGHEQINCNSAPMTRPESSGYTVSFEDVDSVPSALLPTEGWQQLEASDSKINAWAQCHTVIAACSSAPLRPSYTATTKTVNGYARAVLSVPDWSALASWRTNVIAWDKCVTAQR